MSAKVKIIGGIKEIDPEQRVNPTMRKKSIYIETSGSKPHTYEVSFWNQKIDLLKDFTEGSNVEVECYLNGKYFNNGEKKGTYLSLNADTIIERNV